MELVVTYWGSDAGARVFDIIVDGKVIATQRLQRNKPGQFFDVTYPIPIELTKGKEKVTVRFQAHPNALREASLASEWLGRRLSETWALS
jgi:hypothetical protein